MIPQRAVKLLDNRGDFVDATGTTTVGFSPDMMGAVDAAMRRIKPLR